MCEADYHSESSIGYGIRYTYPLAIHRPRSQAPIGSWQNSPRPGPPATGGPFFQAVPPAPLRFPHPNPSVAQCGLSLPQQHLDLRQQGRHLEFHCGDSTALRTNLNQIVHPLSTPFCCISGFRPVYPRAIPAQTWHNRSKSASCVTVQQRRGGKGSAHRIVCRMSECRTHPGTASHQLWEHTSDHLSASGRFAYPRYQFPPIASLGTRGTHSPTGNL